MVAVIVYHKNIFSLYPSKWIDQFRDSILQQTYDDFVIFEMNYGGGEERLFPSSVFISEEEPTFVDAMNTLLTKAFYNGAEAVFNTNCDDVYSLDRIEKQLPYIRQGWDVVSSNFVELKGEEIIRECIFDRLDINKELTRGHNIICHPVVAYSRNFWHSHKYEPFEIPLEDMNLWKRALKDSKMIVLPEFLCCHRIHENSVCHSNNR